MKRRMKEVALIAVAGGMLAFQVAGLKAAWPALTGVLQGPAVAVADAAPAAGTIREASLLVSEGGVWSCDTDLLSLEEASCLIGAGSTCDDEAKVSAIARAQAVKAAKAAKRARGLSSASTVRVMFVGPPATAAPAKDAATAQRIRSEVRETVWSTLREAVL